MRGISLNHFFCSYSDRNIKTQGITTGETSFIMLNGFYLFR